MMRNGRHGNTARPTLYIPGGSTRTSSLPPCPPGLSAHPHEWSKEDVRTWLNWCLEEYALDGVDLNKFSMNGKALCRLRKADFNDRAKNGDVLYNTLQELLPDSKHSPVYVIPPQGRSYQSPHHDGFHYDHMTPASPHDLLNESPMVAASPPPYILSRQKPANVLRTISRQSSQMPSRSPSPSFESPLNLCLGKEQDGGVSGDETGSSVIEDYRGGQRLHIARSPVSRLSPTHPYQHPPTTVSPGSVSPGSRRRSPFGEMESSVPSKVQRLYSTESGYSTPVTNYPNNYLPPPLINREPSPEHFLGLRHKFALTRLDSKDDQTNVQRYSEEVMRFSSDDLSRYNNYDRRDSGTQQEDGDGSEGSMQSESESITDDGHCRPLHSDGRAITSRIPVTVNNVETTDDCYDADVVDGETQGDSKLLWEFIYQLLRSPEYSSLVRWEDEARLVFRIVNPAELAKLWGLQKSRSNMTYEKLSRALRYYYRMNIIVKEPQRRLTYRFVKPPESIQRGQKGAKPGVSHKRRVSSPATSPSCSPTSSSPTSCSPSSSSPTQVPTIALTTPPVGSVPPPSELAANQEAEANQSVINQSVPLVSSPKTYSPITARAYYNLCRQYSMDNGRPWLVSTDGPVFPTTDKDNPRQSLNNNDHLNYKVISENDHSESLCDVKLPFQHSDSADVQLDGNQMIHRRMSPPSDTRINARVIRTKKDDMIKQESEEFTVNENAELAVAENVDEINSVQSEEQSNELEASEEHGETQSIQSGEGE